MAATVLLTLAICGYCAFFAANALNRVPTFTADSMNYVDVARRVVAGDGLVQSTGGFNQPFYLSGDLDLPTAFTAQPPGYPLAIALLARLGLDAADAALVVSALAYAAILLLVFLLGRRIAGAGAGVASLALALLFQPLTHHGRAALSECLAVVFVLLFLLLLDQCLERRPASPPSPSAVAAGSQKHALAARPAPPWRVTRAKARSLLAPFGLGLLAGAAFGVRYALWPLPLVGCVALWLERSSRRAALALVAALATGAALPMGTLLGRNLLLEGRLLPASMPASSSFGESLGQTIEAVAGGWRSTALGNWTDALLLLTLVVLVLGSVLARRNRLSGEGPAVSGTLSRSLLRVIGRLPLLIALWSLLYLAALAWRSSTANFDPIGVRLVLPVTVPLVALVGAVLVWTPPRVPRLAWLPALLIAIALGSALLREGVVWARGGDARAAEFRSERQQWLRDHTGPGDLVIGGGTMDVPFLFPGRSAISYAGLPYTEVLTYPTLERIANRHCPAFDRLLLVVRPTVQLGGGRSDEDPSDWLGPFVADARAGRHESYTLLRPLAVLNEARVYRIACPD